ncbi:MAG: hypothetical protein ABEJ94_00110 [Halorientalis sp.]
MTDDTDDGDDITSAILSGSTYDQLRLQRRTYFSQPTITKLTWQSLLLGGLTLLLPIYLLFPSTVTEYVPSVDPATASPKVLLLGLVGAGTVAFTALLLVGGAVYRIRNHPLDESQAQAVLDIEDFASYLAFGTGGLAIGLTVGYFLLGLGGGATVESYVRTMDGVNPFAASGTGLSVVELAVASFLGCIVLLMIRMYLQLRLLELDGA